MIEVNLSRKVMGDALANRAVDYASRENVIMSRTHFQVLQYPYLFVLTPLGSEVCVIICVKKLKVYRINANMF